MRKSIKVALIISPIIILALIISPFVISHVVNNKRLDNFSEQLYKYPLPEKTILIDKKAVCGKLNGNGDGMDYFACILIKSELSPTELNRYYESVEYKAAKSGGKHNVACAIIQPTGDKLIADSVENMDIHFKALKNVKDYTRYYIVLIYDGGYPAYFDLRGI